MNDRTAAPMMLRDALLQTFERGASDLHVVPGHPPPSRLNGQLVELPGETLTAEAVQRELMALCPEQIKPLFERERNSDFALELSTPARSAPGRARASTATSSPAARRG